MRWRTNILIYKKNNTDRFEESEYKTCLEIRWIKWSISTIFRVKIEKHQLVVSKSSLLNPSQHLELSLDQGVLAWLGFSAWNKDKNWDWLHPGAGALLKTTLIALRGFRGYKRFEVFEGFWPTFGILHYFFWLKPI